MNKLLTTARTTEVDDTSDRLLVLYKDETTLAQDIFLKSLFGEMQTLSDLITEAIKRDRVLSEMEDADAEVETSMRALGTVIKGYSAMPLEQYSTAADALNNVMQKYALSTLKMNYAIQSSNVEALLMDLEAPALQPHIQALPGVSEAIANLRAAQTDFTAKRVAYEKAMVNTQSAPASELKKPLLEMINVRLIPYLDVNKMVSPDTFTRFADTVARVVETTNEAIRRRSTKSTEKQSKEKQ